MDLFDIDIKQEMERVNNNFLYAIKKRHYAFFDLLDILGSYYIEFDNEFGNEFDIESSLNTLYCQLNSDVRIEYKRLCDTFVDFTTLQYNEINDAIDYCNLDVIINSINTIVEFFEIFNIDIDNFYCFFMDKTHKEFFYLFNLIKKNKE